MIIRGWSTHMRHASRTYRVNLDWLLERINSDSNFSVKCVHTMQQILDMFFFFLTKGSCTREKCNELMILFGIVLSLFSTVHYQLLPLWFCLLCRLRREAVRLLMKPRNTQARHQSQSQKAKEFSCWLQYDMKKSSPLISAQEKTRPESWKVTAG